MKIFFNSGRQGHFAREKVSPARGRTSRECEGVGHFKVKYPKVSGSRKHERGTIQRRKEMAFKIVVEKIVKRNIRGIMLWPNNQVEKMHL